jgi:hypothetical protein
MHHASCPAYVINGQHRFYNRWQALQFATRHNTKDIKFDLWNDVFGAQCWTSNPESSWESLLDLRVRQLESTGRPLVLLFSGGTDSYTIYQAFQRNKVHIHGLATKRRKDWKFANVTADWLQTNHPDATTKFISVDNDEQIQDMYSDPYFITDRVNTYNFGWDIAEECMFSKIRKEFQDPLIIMGLEKPRLLLENGHWYSICVDLLFTHVFPPNDVEMFFITPDLPELHIKQCWMLKTWLENSGHNLTDEFVTRDLYDPNKVDYYDFAWACGRTGDLSNSRGEKISNWATKIYIDPTDIRRSHMVGRGSKTFNEGLAAGNKHVLNYIRGHRMMMEPGVVDEYWLQKMVGIITDRFYMGPSHVLEQS